MKFFSNLFASNNDTTTQASFTNKKEVLAKKEYPIVSTADTKSVDEVLKLIKLVRRGRYLSQAEDQKLREITALVTGAIGAIKNTFRLVVLSKDNSTRYSLYQYDEVGDVVKEITLDLPH